MLVDDRLLPVATTSAGTPFDLLTRTPLSGRVIDHALTGLRPDPDGYLRATLLAADGRGARMAWTATCPWLQVHTTHLPGNDSTAAASRSSQ